MQIRTLALTAAILGAGALSSTNAFSAAPAPSLTKCDVFPGDVQLNAKQERQSLVVLASYSNGVTRDVSAEATYAVADPKIAAIDKQSVRPLADGKTELTVSFGGQTFKLPVAVKNAAAERPISFKQDVMPIFMKSGCNSGACHGAARGKDGFRLSLFGFDPDGDHYRLTRELAGRRVNTAIPDACLLVEKSIGTVPHTGGKRFEKDSDLNQTLVKWMEAGAPNDPPGVALPTSLEIMPKQIVLEGTGAKQRMTVRAKYSDGTVRDVTDRALYLSNNDSAAKIAPDGAVTAGERGEAFVMARFYTFTVGSQVIVVPKGDQFVWPSVPENNYVDALVHAKLKKLRIAPSGLCTDEVFIRRAYLDVVGAVPTKEEYEKFLADKDPKKREKLIDELLGRKEFAEIWVMKFAELLQIRTANNVSYKAMLSYYNWLQNRIAGNVPMNQIVKELLGSNGGVFKSPATNYFQTELDTLRLAENVAQVFMGMRIQCAQCHNHPFDRWTMNDYYSFASFFTQIGRKQGEDPREIVVFNAGGGEVNHPVLGRPMPPKFLGGEEPKLAGRDRREVLAEWLAAPENPYFATNLGNIVWAHFMGKGIVDQVDDVRISNPAANPELLEALGKKFREYDFDFKKLVRDICVSRTYQLSTESNPTNELDTRNFAKAQVRRIRAEVMYDVLTQVTETKNKFAGLPLGARAVQIADGQVSTYFLTTFGRASRDTVCSCEVRMEPNLSQALHLLNGDSTGQKIAAGDLIGRMLAKKQTPDQMIEELYVRCFSRKPSAPETAELKKQLATYKEPRKGMEDLFWSLLNSKEFMFNH
ncbi:MAG TPA: DUF1549 and DUF1553 domain-containing protein [Planctomycetia bacterium]|nr:DUF1549 and DUF1553 domain-containing protein [Planctomycetia bacterium]